MCFVYHTYLTHAIKYRYFSYFLIAFKITISNQQIFEVFKTGLNYKIRQRFKNNNKKITFVTKSGFPLIKSQFKRNGSNRAVQIRKIVHSRKKMKP